MKYIAQTLRHAPPSPITEPVTLRSSQGADSRFPTVFFPAPAFEVARLVPIAGERLGWQLADEHDVESQGRFRKMEFRAGQGKDDALGCITIEERAPLGTGIRLHLADAKHGSDEVRDAFFRALFLLYRGGRRGSDCGFSALPPVLAATIGVRAQVEKRA